jgi:hypothetical protein
VGLIAASLAFWGSDGIRHDVYEKHGSLKKLVMSSLVALGGLGSLLFVIMIQLSMWLED